MTECPTGKTAYKYKLKALFALVSIEKRWPRIPGGPVPKRAYRCGLCGY